MRTAAKSFCIGWLLLLAAPSERLVASELEERHKTSPLIAEHLSFLPTHPAVRHNPDLQKPWRDVRFLVVADNIVHISGYVMDSTGQERLVRMAVPGDAAPRPQFWEKILLAKKKREADAQAKARSASSSEIPPGWNPASTRHYPNLVTRKGESFTDVFLRPLNEHTYEALCGQASTRLWAQDLPGPVASDMGRVVQIVKTYGLVANAYTHLRNWDEAGQPGKSYQETAKQPLPGRVFAAIRPGYLLLDMRWKATQELAGAELLKPFADRRFATINAPDFTSLDPGADWWNIKGVTPALKEPMPEADRFSPIPPTDQMILRDPFEGTACILANRKGEIKTVWAAETAQKKRVAIAGTEGGYFYGYLEIVDPLDETSLNWVQATQSRKDKFELRKVQTEKVSTKKKLLSLLDFTASKSLTNPLITVDRARITPAHLKRILDGGLPALLVELAVPVGDGIEPPQQVETTGAGAGLEIQKVTDAIAVFPESWDASLFRFRVATEQRVREVEYRRTGGKITTTDKPWKKKEASEFVELSPDLDGGLRFTDGKKILELVPDRLGKLELNTWEVVPNGLVR